MINATVSHELRNPLNSLIALNVEKKFLYKQLKKVIFSCGKTKQEEKKIIRITD
jgi:signal transduction histidine kinase